MKHWYNRLLAYIIVYVGTVFLIVQITGTKILPLRRETVLLLGWTAILSAAMLLSQKWMYPKATPEEISRKERFKYKKVPGELKSDTPAGIVCGKDTRDDRWVCIDPMHMPGTSSTLIVGASGSGKSSASIIPSLVSCLNAKDKDGRRYNVFSYDIKGELSYMSTHLDDDGVIIMAPDERRRWGYDPFYQLHDGREITNQLVVETVTEIAEVLIEPPQGNSDPFWATAGRNLFTGLTIHYILKQQKAGKPVEFVDAVSYIMSAPPQQLITTALGECGPNSPEYTYLVLFQKMGDETLYSVYLSTCNAITIYTSDANLKFFLRTNPKRCKPSDINQKSIFLVLRESRLSVESPLIKLITNQVLHECEQRPDISMDPNQSPVLVMLDEMPRIMVGAGGGKGLQSILNICRTGRSRGVCCVSVAQSMSVLSSIYSKADADDFLTNNSLLILSVKTPEDAKRISGYCGNYYEEQISTSRGDGKKNETRSYREKPLVSADELLTIESEGECYLVCRYGAFRLKKSPWYEDKGLSSIISANKDHNNKLRELDK